jgi:outer membrane immunogenic protein
MLSKFLLSSSLLLAMAASAAAADLPSEKGPPVYAPPPPPAFSWSGVYLGGQVGYGWGTSNVTTNGVGVPNLSQSGVVGGAHIGYNYQVSQFVFGLEGDVNGSSERDSALDFVPAGVVDYGVRKNVDASIRGRIGYAFDRVLVYATGGAAYGNFRTNYNDGTSFNSFNDGRIGWTVGGGLEYAIDNNWSVRAEYRYTDYGHINDTPFLLGAFNSVSQHIRDNRVQAGFSYKFDMFAPPAPIISKY